MMTGDESSDQYLKPRRSKSREVSSRFLSPTFSSLNHSAASVPSPTQGLSPIRRKPSSSDGRKNGSLEDSGVSRGGLWQSTATTTSSELDKKLDTLANHLGNDRFKDLVDRRKDEKSKSGRSSNEALFISKQRSSTEFSRFENDRDGFKENHRPIIGGSLRHSGRLSFSVKSSSNSSSSSSSSSNTIVPGRLSVDENALYRKSSSSSSTSSRRHSIVPGDILDSDADYGSSKDSSFSSYLASTARSKKSGKEAKPQRVSSDSTPFTISLDGSPKVNKFSIRNAMKRANSLTGYGSASSQWALSPGRSASPPISFEHKKKLMSFSSLKPPTSPSRATGVDKLLHLGLDLFKSKKSSSSSSSLGPVGPVDVDAVHQLRLLHNRAVQWRYVNARAEVVDENIAEPTQINLVCAWDGLKKLQRSVLQKRVQLEKEKLKMKLNFILHSQMKLLETWGDMERQHISAVSKTKESLHSVVCRVPLIDGAKMSSQSASIAFRQAWDLSASIHTTLTLFSPMAEETVSSLSELAEVVAQEKLLLEEFRELYKTISTLEMQERSLKCTLIQLKSWKEEHHQNQQQHETISF